MTHFKENIKLLEKIRADYDRQLKKINKQEKPDEYDRIKESRNETIEKMYYLWWRETD